MVAVCGIGGAGAGPFLSALARRAVAPGRAAWSPPDPDPQADHDPDPAPGSKPAQELAQEPAPSAAPVHRWERGAVALVTALACALMALRLGAVPQLGAYCLLCGTLVLVSVTDLRSGLVPRRIVYPAAVLLAVGFLAASAADATWRPMLGALGGAAAAFVLFYGAWWVAPRALGFGDVRLAALCGGALGWLGLAPLYLGFLAAFVAGALAGVAVLALRGRRRFPFAPALAAGTAFGVLWGGSLGALWLHGG